jgi:hypothetical protein
MEEIQGENLPLADSELIRRVLDRFEVVIHSGERSCNPTSGDFSGRIPLCRRRIFVAKNWPKPQLSVPNTIEGSKS